MKYQIPERLLKKLRALEQQRDLLLQGWIDSTEIPNDGTVGLDLEHGQIIVTPTNGTVLDDTLVQASRE